MIDRPAAGALALLPLPLPPHAYPALLARISDPPARLWVRGDPCALEAPCVALVGSRAASRYGLEVAERLAADLARAGVTVVSGLARGVDSAAHAGALTTGRTVAVLGSGVDVIYPAEHAPLADRIVAGGGAIVSELPPGSPPRRGHFPRRNRLISGLSLAVVVIEASTRSGSLQTARFALDQGRDVLAVPGSIVGDRFRGSHALLRDGAKLVESASDVLDELRLPDPGLADPRLADRGLADPGLAGAAPAAQRARTEAEPAADPAGLLAAMTPGAAYGVEELVVTTGLPASEVLRQVLRFEVQGCLVRAPGPRYIRPHRW